jgi:hypothetical protein
MPPRIPPHEKQGRRIMEVDFTVEDAEAGLKEYCEHTGEMCNTQGMLAIVAIVDNWIREDKTNAK